MEEVADRGGRGVAPNPWGPWRWRLEQLHASCADYVGRIGRCLRGEVPRSGHYVSEKAQSLRDAAAELVDVSHDIAWLVTRCGAGVAYEAEGERFVEDCALPASHAGPHDARPPRPPLEQAARAARDLAGQTRTVADVLAWADRSQQLDTDTRQEVMARLRKMHRGVQDLSRAIEATPAAGAAMERRSAGRDASECEEDSK